MSPYSGSMYHGSPLLLSILGPLTTKRIEGQPSNVYCSLMFVFVDLITAILIRATGQRLLMTNHKNMQLLNLPEMDNNTSGNINAGELASLIFLLNPLTIITCVGSSTSPIENVMVVLAIFGACSHITPLAAFGWVMATHLSLYPVILVVPVILLLGSGLDSHPSKLFRLKNSNASESSPQEHKVTSHTSIALQQFSWRLDVMAYWKCLKSCISIWDLFVASVSGGHPSRTHVFILTVEDLSPNIGVLWYFFAEVFEFFRTFFLMVFHLNILFMILPLSIRLWHRPCFLAFVYITISAMLKSYPSVGDSALYLGLLGLFANELAEMKCSFFLFCGYITVFLFSPVMHNLWIWRGTGNSNFYFATGLGYACLQTVLIVESVSTVLNHKWKLRKQLT